MFLQKEFLVAWTFWHGILRHLNISTQAFWHLGYCDEISECRNVPMPICPWCQKILVPKSPLAKKPLYWNLVHRDKMSMCRNIYRAETYMCRNIPVMKCLCRNDSGRNVRCRNGGKPIIPYTLHDWNKSRVYIHKSLELKKKLFCFEKNSKKKNSLCIYGMLIIRFNKQLASGMERERERYFLFQSRGGHYHLFIGFTIFVKGLFF